MSQTVSAPGRQLLDSIAWVRRQVILQAVVEGATRGALLGAPVWVAAAVAVQSLQVAAVELFVFASLGALWRLLRVPDQRGAARYADSRLGLEDRLLTALDRLADEAPMAELQRANAWQAFQAAPHRTLRSVWPRWSLLALVAVIAGAGIARSTAADDVGRELVAVVSAPSELASAAGGKQTRGAAEPSSALAPLPSSTEQGLAEEAPKASGKGLLPPGAQASEAKEGSATSSKTQGREEGSEQPGGSAESGGGRGRAAGTGSPGARPQDSFPAETGRLPTDRLRSGTKLQLQRLASEQPGDSGGLSVAEGADGARGPRASSRGAKNPLPALPVRYHAVVARYMAGSVLNKAQLETKP